MTRRVWVVEYLLSGARKWRVCNGAFAVYRHAKIDASRLRRLNTWTAYRVVEYVPKGGES